jgi:positive regulator of sigma E activity
MHEEIIEEGIVVQAENGTAEVALLETKNCEECHAKIFCKPSQSELKTIKVNDSFNCQPGDKVSFSVGGGDVLLLTTLLYGIPLVLLLAGIFLGFSIFLAEYRELYSFLLGLGLIAIYYLILFLTNKSKSSFNRHLPRIINVSRI